MKSLVIGGNGFTGSHLVDALLERGHSVRVFDLITERFRDPLPDVEFVAGDFGDSATLAQALVDVDQVFHLVSTTVPSTSNLDPINDIQGNLINTVRLLQLMRDAGIRRIIYLSSGGTVYGIPITDPVPEGHPLRPISSYGVVKVAIENYLYMESYLHGLRPVILRASNPYGPRQGYSGVQGVIGTFLRKVAKGERIEIWGDGNIVRDFIYVKDLAELCVSVSETDKAACYNAGSGVGHSINEVVEMIGRVVGRRVEPLYEAGREYDVPRIVLDTSLVCHETGWAPRVTLEQGLAETWDWVQSNI